MVTPLLIFWLTWGNSLFLAGTVTYMAGLRCLAFAFGPSCSLAATVVATLLVVTTLLVVRTITSVASRLAVATIIKT